MTYDALFLCRLIPADLTDEVNRKSHSGLTAAAEALQWHIINGFEEVNNRSGTILNILPVGSFPKRYRDWRVPKTVFRHTQGATDSNLGFINVSGLKHVLRPFVASRAVRAWAQTATSHRKVVFVYTPDRAFLRAVRLIKRREPGLTVVLILPDVPRYLDLVKNSGFVMRAFKRWAARHAESQLDLFDGYVVLAEGMVDLLDLKKPHLVIEGIATELTPIPAPPLDDRFRVIFHAGTLNLAFGIAELLEAFGAIDDPSYRLRLCGTGDAVPLIEAAQLSDPRIEFLGRLTRREVLEHMGAATAIVNPRRPVGAYTHYSFPSKNLEALSSGRPLVAHKLGGIPHEYDEHILYVKADTVPALRRALTDACERPVAERLAAAEHAREFVLNHKGSLPQAKRLLRFVTQLSEGRS